MKIGYSTISYSMARRRGFELAEMGEFDDDLFLQEFESEFKKIGLTIFQLPEGKELLNDLANGSVDLVWNMNSGYFGMTREAQIPTICEYLRVPFTGAGSWTAFISQDKYSSYLLASAISGLKIPETHLIKNASDLDSLRLVNKKYLAKPAFECSSRGLSIPTNSQKTLMDHCSRHFDKWGTYLVQEYIDGFEISANLLCDNNGKLHPLEPMLVEHSDEVFSDQQKVSYNETKYTPVPNLELANRIKKVAAQIGKCFRFQDYARIDLIVDHSENIYFLETNLCPSFALDDDFISACFNSGISYSDILRRIIKSSLSRYRGVQ